MAAPKPEDVFGGGRGGAAPDGDGDYDGDQAGSEDVPPEFEAAFQEYESAEDPAERMKALYRCIEACKGGSGGLALVLGSPKGGKR